MRTHGGADRIAMPFLTHELSAIQKSADGRKSSEIENTRGCDAHLHASLGLLQVTSDATRAYIAYLWGLEPSRPWRRTTCPRMDYSSGPPVYRLALACLSTAPASGRLRAYSTRYAGILSIGFIVRRKDRKLAGSIQKDRYLQP